jgi:hypothetical protein
MNSGGIVGIGPTFRLPFGVSLNEDSPDIDINNKKLLVNWTIQKTPMYGT